MIREIVHDELFLAQRSEPATAKDKQVVRDLLDTLKLHREECVGMAANMIGEPKRIIAVVMGRSYLVMLNPEIIKKEKPFAASEGCLSLQGERPATRYEKIEVVYQDERLRRQRASFSGWTAQIIQHECDHLEGIII